MFLVQSMTLLTLLISSQPADNLNTNAAWEIVKEENGITVSQRAVPGRSMPVFRGEGEIEAGIFELLAVLQDVNVNPEWMHACREAALLEKYNEKEHLVYNRSAAPWPISDRDVVVKTKAIINRAESWVRVVIKSTQSTLKPPVDGVVRMPRMNGEFYFAIKTDTLTQVRYTIDADPGGWLPVWLARMASRNIPLRTLENFRKRVKQTNESGIYRKHIKRLKDLNWFKLNFETVRLY